MVDVSHPNDFGAMKRSSFNATAHYNPNTNGWVVEKVFIFENSL